MSPPSTSTVATYRQLQAFVNYAREHKAVTIYDAVYSWFIKTSVMQTTKKAMIKCSTVSSFAEVWECSLTQNKSLHTTVEFEGGQVITNFGDKEVLDRPNYLTVQIGDCQHIMLDPEYLQYINHSCNPNVFFDTENRILIALRKIEIGEELTFFYPSTEWSMNRGFNCICQNENCLGYIQGAAAVPLNILTKYKLSQLISAKLGMLTDIN
ncbi:nuclear protein SET [Tolypothrix sp. NIES-4075]|uniref:SET domain-containing protein-lysine N-methyltransferase n=1 Tax=Tolypothrix sp. NIES-4075 TaxID=2005459 RepID=UPI000B6923B3|nr:SET domain-containing protein-lysine N-methyltransferase [Tolypothrix sp. NIES-4075]GAX40566.1 nuclear protein SET [Tolypothrix sp. NIES-4075]